MVAGIAFFVVLDVPIRRRCKRLNLGIELREEQRDNAAETQIVAKERAQSLSGSGVGGSGGVYNQESA